MLDNKEAATGIDSATNDAKDGNERLYFFKLSDGIGVLEESLVLKHKKNDCRLLCRLLGITISDNDRLTSKIDEKNIFYDSKENVFTMLQQLNVNLSRFGFFKHWLYFGHLDNLNIKKDDINCLQEIANHFGVNGLSKAVLLYITSMESKDKEEYNPMTPDKDVLKQYQWAQFNRGQQWNIELGFMISQTSSNDGGAWFRRPKTLLIQENKD